MSSPDGSFVPSFDSFFSPLKKRGIFTKAKALFLSSPKTTLIIIASLFTTVGLVVAIALTFSNQDIRQIASGDSCAPFANQNQCNGINGCSWQSSLCVNYAQDSQTCTNAGCTWTPYDITCSDYNSNKTQCDSYSPYGCYWRWDSIPCSIADCVHTGCSLDTITDYHTCSLSDGDCRQTGCEREDASCSGVYQATTYQCTGQHVCEGTSPCSSYNTQSGCEAVCCNWTPTTATLSCVGLGESSCQSKTGCTYNPATCSSTYTTTTRECTGSYQGTTGTCQGGIREMGGTCTGTPSSSFGTCTGTIARAPTSTPVPTNTPIPTPTQIKFPDNCQLLTDTLSCPEGTIRNDNCHSSCQSNNVLCCEDLPEDKEVCNRGARDCSEDEKQSRYCIVPDSTSQYGYWSQFVDCPEDGTCAAGICLHPTPTPNPLHTPTPAPEFTFDCEKNQRECCQPGQDGCTTNQSRYCIYNESASVSMWSSWTDCPSSSTCTTGICLQHTPTPKPTTTPFPTTAVGCNILPGEQSCPVGTIASSDCDPLCSQANILCCTDLPEDKEVCNRGQRECVEKDGKDASRYCIVPDSTSQYGYWSNPVACPANSNCQKDTGICLHHTPTPAPQTIATAEFGGECIQNQRECCQGQDGCKTNQYRTCIYDEFAGILGEWSPWKSCGTNQTCAGGNCVGSYIAPTPTPAVSIRCIQPYSSCESGQMKQDNCSGCPDPVTSCCIDVTVPDDAECTPNELQCAVSSTHPEEAGRQYCRADGTWSGVIPCASNQVCEEGVCVSSQIACGTSNPCLTNQTCLFGSCIDLVTQGTTTTTYQSTDTIQYTTPAGAITVPSCHPTDQACLDLHLELNSCKTEQECREATKKLYTTLAMAGGVAVAAPLVVPAGIAATSSVAAWAPGAAQATWLTGTQLAGSAYSWGAGAAGTLGALGTRAWEQANTLAMYPGAYIPYGISHLPSWAQTGVALGLKGAQVAKTAGFIGSYGYCSQNPYDEKCVAFAATLMGGGFDGLLRSGLEDWNRVVGGINQSLKTSTVLHPNLNPREPANNSQITRYISSQARLDVIDNSKVYSDLDAETLERVEFRLTNQEFAHGKANYNPFSDSVEWRIQEAKTLMMNASAHANTNILKETFRALTPHDAYMSCALGTANCVDSAVVVADYLQHHGVSAYPVNNSNNPLIPHYSVYLPEQDKFILYDGRVKSGRLIDRAIEMIGFSIGFSN